MSRISRGFLWSSIDRFSVQGVSFLLSILIARIVSPSSYGLIVMIQVFMTICQTFIDGGFANALIQKQQRTENDYYTAFIFNMSVAFFLYLVLFFASPLIATFYNEPQLELITKVIGLNLIFSSLSIVQKTRLTIDFDFKTQAKAGLLAVVISGSIGVICAYFGLEVWALVIQSILNNILISIFLMFFSRWMPKFVFSKDSFKHLFNFGSKLLIANLITSIYLNIYNLVIGKKYSSESLAYYNRAFTLTQIPSSNIEMVLSRMIYPLECKLQNDPAELKKTYLKYLHISNFIILPLMFLLIGLAKPLVSVVLTDKWLPAVPYLILYAINFTMYPWLDQSVQLLNVLGRTGLNLKTQFYKRIVSFIILFATIPFGIEIICLGIVVNTTIELIISLIADRWVMNISVLEQIKSQLDVFIISIFTSLFCYIFCMITHDEYVQLFFGGVFGLLFYFSLAYMLKMEEVKILLRYIKK